jgi:hypothetical protein
MKWIILLISVFAGTFCFSQDMLIKISGDSIKVKILEIGLTEVKYKNYDDLSDIIYGIYRSDVYMIRYSDGRVEKFDLQKDAESADKNLSPDEKCACGRSDAANFHGHKGGAFACGAYLGIFAVIGTAMFQQTPQMGRRTVDMSKHKGLFFDPYYLKCYSKKAKADMMGMEVQGVLASILVPIAVILLLTP